MIDGSLALPLYHQVAAVLRQRISDANYPAGERLASEDELAAEFSVSRATIRQAVGALVAEGLVARKQGSGTYVREHNKSMLRQRYRGSLGDLIRESHKAAPRDIEVVHDQQVSRVVAIALELEDPTSTVTVVRRTRMMDDEPFAYTVTYVPSDIGKNLTVDTLVHKALMEALIDDGHELVNATQSIRAQLADAELSGRIDVDLGAAVLYVERVVRTKDERPAEFVTSWYRGDRYEYTVTLDLGEETYSGLA
ncbi:MAG: transcriptional regulator [Microbacteriaceae bacterium]|jgi:GntR family transcriptional regulator|nr:transcriptional regulator [Microbacteriaceae bacterium]